MNRKLWMVTFLSAISLVLAAGENLIRNGSFEERDGKGLPRGWAVPENARLASDAAEGKLSIEFNGGISQWGIPVPSGRYQVRFQLKKDNMNWLGVRLFCRDKSNQEIKSKQLTRYFGQGKAFPDWQRIEFLLDVPENSGSCGLIFSSHGGLMLIDDVSIRRADATSSDGELVFEDRFQRSALGPDWKVESGNWKVENGSLVVSGTGTENRIKFARPLGKNLRIEYICSSSSPQDLSAMLGTDPEKNGLDGYLFGFGASYNSYNYIAKAKPFSILERTIQEGFNTGVVPGKKHRITIEKREGRLRFFRDGRLELVTEDVFSDEIAGRSFGFFTYHTGCYENVKVYRLPEEKNIALHPEYPVEKVIFHDFSKAEGENGIVSVPTWDYAISPEREQIMVKDPCLKTADTAFELPGTHSAIVEFDIFLPGAREVRMELADSTGRSVAAFVIDRKGMFFAEGADGKVPLASKIEYRRRQLYDTFAVEQEKWYTFRLKYDVRNQRLDNIALLNYYTENEGGYSASQPVKQGDYVSLGGKLPFRKHTSSPATIRFHSEDGDFLLDNVLLFGPVGFKSVKGKNILLPGGKLLGLAYRQRRDPMHLKSQSMRNLDNRNLYITPAIDRYRFGKGKVSFQKWARRYNESMMNMAFLQERIELADRKAYYNGNSENTASLREKYGKLELLQEKALAAFAEAFWSRTDENMLHAKAEPALHSLEKELAVFRKQMDHLDGAGKIIPAEPVYHNWELRYDPALKLWTRNNRPEAFISSVSQLQGDMPHDATEFVLDKMRALGIQPASVTVGGVTNGSPKEGELFNLAAFQSGIEKSQILVKQHGLHPYGLAWMQHGTGQLRMPVPKWWFDRNKSDRDLFFSFPDGTPGDKATPIYWGWPQYPFLALNFWNPAVQDYIAKRYFLYGKLMGERKDLFCNTMFYLGGESSITLPNGLYPGYAASAVAEFRNQLKKKYAAIQNLNAAWESNYESFDSIVPPPPGSPPSPLRYEFNTFVHREYFERYIRLAKENLERGYGGKLSIGHDFQDTFSRFDMPAFFDNVSIVLFHSYQIWDRKIYPKYLRSLAEATGTPWGAVEWGYTQGCKTMFNLEEIRRHGLREISHQLMFGCVSPNLFAHGLSGGTSDWQYGFSMTDHRVGFLLFNHHASFWRIAKERGIRFGETALLGRTVRPDVAVLEVDSARRNALPENSVYSMCKEFAMEMEKQSIHYGFLFEKLVVDGRMKLQEIPAVFIPNGIVMTKALDQALERYLEDGGIILAFSPPGVYNEFGKRKTDGLLARAFPGIKWEHEHYSRWTGGKNSMEYYSAPLGKGRIYVFPSPMQFENCRKRFLALLKQHVNPAITCSQNDFQYSFRERNALKYLYVLNYSIDSAKEGEFSLNGRYRVTDISLPEKQNVRTELRKGRTSFKTRLAPAELALFEISEL